MSGQEGPCAFITGEHAGGHAELCAHVGNGGTLGHGQACHALAKVLHHPPYIALGGQDAQQLENDILGSHPVGHAPREFDASHLGGCHVERTACHGHRHVHTTCAYGHHADAAAGRGMRITAQQDRAGLAKAFEVYLVADAIAGTRVIRAALGGHGLEVQVIIVVFRPKTGHIVVHIAHGQVCLDAPAPHGFVQQKRGGTCGVLGEGLVNANAHRLTGLELPLFQVLLENLINKCLSHGTALLS